MTVPIKFTLTHPDAVPPAYAHEGDSGFDLYSVEEAIQLLPHERRIFRTGLRFELPPGYELQIRPTSGASAKTNRTVHFGTLDSGYRGECGVIVENSSVYVITIQKGAKMAQGVIMPVPAVQFIEVEAHKLSLTSRGENGFGSTEKEGMA